MLCLFYEVSIGMNVFKFDVQIEVPCSSICLASEDFNSPLSLRGINEIRKLAR